MWFGKVLGLLFGWMVAGPFGALFGLFVGHCFDKGARTQWYRMSGNVAKAQQAFFESTFKIMGHIAKADGHISKQEINEALKIMQQMRLNKEQEIRAKAYFSEGKNASFNLEDELRKFSQACNGQQMLLRMFVEIQFRAARENGTINADKQRILQMICEKLRMAGSANYQSHSYQQYQSAQQYTNHDLNNAYSTLGVSKDASEAEIKRAYRKLMSQHHPDKLVARGLPEEMIKLATEKTQEIQTAYEIAKKEKAMA